MSHLTHTHTHIRSPKHNDWQREERLQSFTLTSLSRNVLQFDCAQVRWHHILILGLHTVALQCHHFSHKTQIWIFVPLCAGPHPGNRMLPGYQTDVSVYAVTWPPTSALFSYCFHISPDTDPRTHRHTHTDTHTHTLEWLQLCDGAKRNHLLQAKLDTQDWQNTVVTTCRLRWPLDWRVNSLSRRFLHFITTTEAFFHSLCSLFDNSDAL